MGCFDDIQTAQKFWKKSTLLSDDDDSDAYEGLDTKWGVGNEDIFFDEEWN